MLFNYEHTLACRDSDALNANLVRNDASMSTPPARWLLASIQRGRGYIDEGSYLQQQRCKLSVATSAGCDFEVQRCNTHLTLQQ